MADHGKQAARVEEQKLTTLCRVARSKKAYRKVVDTRQL